MLGFLFATVAEATPFVHAFAENRVDRIQKGNYIHGGDTVVTVTGRGKINATLGTERLLGEYDLDALVHAGGAVSLSNEVEPGAILGATHVLEGDRVDLEDPSYPRMPLEVPFDSVGEGTLVTQDHPTSDPDARSYWERIAEIRDTTGYAVAFVAGQYGVPCHIVKGITGPVGNNVTQNESAEVYRALTDVLVNQLESVETPG